PSSALRSYSQQRKERCSSRWGASCCLFFSGTKPRFLLPGAVGYRANHSLHSHGNIIIRGKAKCGGDVVLSWLKRAAQEPLTPWLSQHRGAAGSALGATCA
ncbi:hypothetical protein EK904_001244, partial [Melospiza melodia maxima]